MAKPTAHGAAAEYAVWHGPRMEYAPVPVAIITDPRLYHSTVRVYAYMLAVVTRPASTNPGGRWIIRRRDVMRQCAVGAEAWTRAVRELTSVGLYRGEPTNLPAGSTEVGADGLPHAVGGQRRYAHHIYPASGAYGAASAFLPAPPPPGAPPGGYPLAGEPPPLYSGIETPGRSSTRARKRAVPPPDAASAATSHRSGKAHQAPAVYHGCRVHAGTDDRERVDACIAKRGTEWVESFAGDRLPLPSEVEQAIAADARRAQRSDRASRCTDEHANPTDPEADAAAFAATLANLTKEPNP